ncbi:probable purine permease 11 [Beta vulgaris subsp. vulgaris]|uniref:probable purine permease 11 n=1 Tax=Beta vulgaris subsp. vulgaris TaxID=3555 RepID=UPI00203668A9|nr:probable purine permease 11 [Beta vulgaris subsp. vulgaris]
MDATQDQLVQQSRGKEVVYDSRSNEDNSITNHNNNKNKKLYLPKLKHLIKWLRITTYIFFILVGQTIATLLGRLYFDKGGNSKWMATFVQSAGFPIIIPFKFFSSSPTSLHLSISKLTSIYFAFGLLSTGTNLMYSYGLVYLPVSTYSLLCASQLAFNAVTSFFINSKKLTGLVINSVVILTISACLLGINADDEGDASNNIAKGKYIIGFLCTLGASAMYSLMSSLVEYYFEKVIKEKSYGAVQSMQIYPAIVTTCACVVGLFGSGEWRTLKEEIRDYKTGTVPYVMTLTFTAITWQVFSIGYLGLIFEVSSLFSNVIGTVGLPLVPIFAVVFFHDKMNGVKVISMVLAMWGFISYIYQHYLDNIEAQKARKHNGGENLALC